MRLEAGLQPVLCTPPRNAYADDLFFFLPLDLPRPLVFSLFLAARRSLRMRASTICVGHTPVSLTRVKHA